ncbi:hypothetical protein F4825DRAFT_471578 [Nemania diffusa]|nr:hypothetical protein F4825DRAFT_471578 [Nemania diffusa]
MTTTTITNSAYINSQNFVTHDGFSYAATPMSTGLPYHIRGWPVTHQLLLPCSEPLQELDIYETPRDFGDNISLIPDSPVQPRLSHIDNKLPSSARSPSSLLPSAYGRATQVVNNPDSQGPQFRPTPTVALPENGNSPSYQCLECPKMPKFVSQRDLQRHRDSTVPHWNENTRFYQCCCDAYRARKDNHRRHVLNCKAPALNPYTCHCGRDTWERHEHLEHIRHCGSARCR